MITYFVINMCLGLIPTTLFLLSQAEERNKITVTDLLFTIGIILFGVISLVLLIGLMIGFIIEESKEIVIWKRKNKVNPVL